MIQYRFLLLLIAGLLLQDCCWAQGNAASPDNNLVKFTATPNTSSEGDLTPFTVDLYRAAVKDNRDNALISSFGAASMIGALYVGSNGQTEEELKSLLHWKSSKEDWIKYIKYIGGCFRETSDLQTQSAFWIQNNYMIKTFFIQTLQNYSFITVKNIDFTKSSSGAQINQWIRMQSNNKILPLYSSMPTNTKLVLMDFFVFDGAWKFPFQPNKTHKSFFTTIEGADVETSFMVQLNHYNYLRGPDFQYIEIPCRNDIYSFNILLPLDSEEFMQFENKITPEFLKKCQNESTLTEIDVALPIFTQTYNWNLKSVIKQLNANTLFSRHSDQSDISNMDPLFVSQISQMLHIAVNEQGPTTAANVNSNVNSIIVTKGNHIIEQLSANRPFIYYIQERISGAILCIGRYVNPDKAEDTGFHPFLRKLPSQTDPTE